MAEGRFIAYYRVSTERQGQSGLGLEAQRHAVQEYLNGGDWKLVAEYSEVESGKRGDRPELEKALRRCKKEKATLVIAKLDRLSRSLAFIAKLIEAGVDFVAVDMPHAGKLTVQIMAAMAEHERDMISQRTKAALQAAKARGVQLGNPDIETAREAATAALSKQADEFAKQIAPTIKAARKAGKTLQQIADQLNAQGVQTRRGGEWYPSQVSNVLRRAG